MSISKFNRGRPFRPDRRTRAGRRIAEFEANYLDALGGDLNPVQREHVQHAAEMAVVAEISRESFLKGELAADDLVRVERAHALAVSRLGLKQAEKPSGPTLQQYLAQKAAAQ